MKGDDRRGSGRLEKALGQTIRQLRHERRLSQQQLAERAEVSRSYLNQLETGSREYSRGVSTDIIERLALALEVSPSLLLEAARARQEGRSSDYLRAQADLLEDASPEASMSPGFIASPSRRAAAREPVFGQAADSSGSSHFTPAHVRALREFEMLLPYLSEEDLEIVLSMMRRLARAG